MSIDDDVKAPGRVVAPTAAPTGAGGREPARDVHQAGSTARLFVWTRWDGLVGGIVLVVCVHAAGFARWIGGSLDPNAAMGWIWYVFSLPGVLGGILAAVLLERRGPSGSLWAAGVRAAVLTAVGIVVALYLSGFGVFVRASPPVGGGRLQAPSTGAIGLDPGLPDH